MIWIKILIILLYLVGIVLVVPGLGGLWVISGTNLLFKLIYPELFPWWFVILAIFLSGLSELLDWVFGIIGARKEKASPVSIALSLFLSIVFGILLTGVIPIIGTIFGVFLGTFIGCFIGETLWYKKKHDQAIRASFGALLGRIFSVFTKLFFGIGVVFTGILLLFFLK